MGYYTRFELTWDTKGCEGEAQLPPQPKDAVLPAMRQAPRCCGDW